LVQLAKRDPVTAARIEQHRRIIAFRNILIHGYADVDDRLVWDIVESKLAALRRASRRLRLAPFLFKKGNDQRQPISGRQRASTWPHWLSVIYR
jgi:Protein of unknown function DUF86